MSTYGPEYGRGVANASKKAGELWKLMELSPGDIVIANKGTAQVVGIGTVVEPGYTWREDVDGFPHTVSVHWDDTTQRTIDPVKSWANATVARVSGDLYEKIRSATKLPPPTPPAEAPDDLWLEIQSALTKRRQVILYGPPGTGKTRAALGFADWWLAGSGLALVLASVARTALAVPALLGTAAFVGGGSGNTAEGNYAVATSAVSVTKASR